MKTKDKKAFFSYVVPSVLAFALSGVYTIVDGFFIGQSLGDLGLAAITLGYPVAALIGAVGTGLGLSGAIRFAILNAQGEEKKCEECFGAAALLMLLVGAVLSAGLFFAADSILRLLGAQGEVHALCVEYARVIALGAIFQLLATGLVPFLRNRNGSSFAMVAMILGFLTNIALDYLFVWVWGAGMTGAALATIIGQAATMLASIGFLAVRKARLRLPAKGELGKVWGRIAKVSLSPFGLTFSPTVTMLLMNRFLLLYGDERAVAVYGCVGYVVSILYLLLQGVGDGCQPLISSFYGEGNLPAARQTRRLAYQTAAALTLLCLIGLFLARGKIGALFGASGETGEEVGRVLPLFLASLLFLAFSRITTSYLYATEKTALSYLLVYAEPGLTLLFLLILPLALALTGVWLAVPLAQAVSGLLALAAKIGSDRKDFSKA